MDPIDRNKLRTKTRRNLQTLALLNAFQSTSNFNATIMLLRTEEIKLKLANKNE
jgi:hypothetical protein